MKLQNKQDIAVFKGEGKPFLYLHFKDKKNPHSGKDKFSGGDGEILLGCGSEM